MSPLDRKIQYMEHGTTLMCVFKGSTSRPRGLIFLVSKQKWYSSVKSLSFGLILNLPLGRCWMDALELALKCSSLLKRTMIREGKEHDLNSSADSSHVSFYGLIRANNLHSGENLP